MDDLLLRVCAHLGEDPANVINPCVEGDEFVLVACHGTKGNPKHRVRLADLPEPDPEPDATDAARALAAEHDLDLHSIAGSGADGRVLVRDVRALIDKED